MTIWHDDEKLEIPSAEAWIVIISNTGFDAAGFAYDENEFNYFIKDSILDGRPRSYVLIDREIAEKVTGYSEVRSGKNAN